MDRNISPVNTKGQDSGYPENEEEEMKKRIVIAMVTGLIIASLGGCGTKTDATDQEVPENSAVESGAETDETATDEITSTEVIGNDTEENGEFVGAEDDSIYFYGEQRSLEFPEIGDMTFEPYDEVFTVDGYVPVVDGEGYWVGEFAQGATVAITAKSDALYRYKNPIANTEYDYLYTPVEYLTPVEKLQVNATEMAQYIQDYINTYGIQDVEYTFVNEATSDMEVYEFRMDSVYDDNSLLEYWLNQMISFDNTDVLMYETLYVECEEDTDEWIICRIYYKDKIELEY